jgi:hypothetical protein
LAPAWDDAIRKNHLRGGRNYDGAEASYVRFARDVRQDLRDTDDLCAALGFGLEDMPAKLGRPTHTTAAQLMIEYYFVTITKNAGPPPSCFGVGTPDGR